MGRGDGWGNGAVDDAFATVDDAAAPAASQDSNDNLTSCSPRLPCVCASVFASACACVGAVHLDALQKRIPCMSKQVRMQSYFKIKKYLKLLSTTLKYLKFNLLFIFNILE